MMLRLPALLLVLAATPALAAPPTYYPPQDGRLPFSEAVRAGDFLIVSGQIGPAADGKAEPFAAEASRAMNAVAAILKRRGASMDQVVKCTVMLKDMADWPAFNGLYASYFKPGRLPARSAFAAAGLAAGARLEVECWAYVGR